MLMALPFAFASVEIGDRVTTYEDGDQIVGDRGYADFSGWNTMPDVFVCALKDGTVKEYGMNLRNSNDLGYAIELVKQLAEMSFAGFDHYGCLRARI